MDLKDKLAIKIRTLRVEAGLSQHELADQIGRSHDVISKIERAQALPSLDVLEAICNEFNMNLSEFFAESVPIKIDKKRYAIMLEIFYELEKMAVSKLKKTREVLAVVNKK